MPLVQLELTSWSCLHNATGGALKPEKYFWYILDYECIDGEWQYTDRVPQELAITNPDGTTSEIKQEKVASSKKILGVHDSPSGGNSAHLAYIKEKISMWVSQVLNRHLPNHMAWFAYRHQLWPGIRFGLGKIMNDLKETNKLLHREDYRILNALEIACNVSKELRGLHTSFGGFGLYDLQVEQLICRVNMIM